MAIAEKNIVITSKDELNQTVIYKPYTSVDLVEGAVSSINGITPDDNGNVNISRIDNANNAKSADSVEWNNVKNKPTNVSSFSNDAGYLTQHQSLDGYAKTSVANTWTAEQSLNNVNITYERYTASSVSGTSTSATPTASTAVYTATGNFTLYLNSIASNLANGQTTVFTAYINANADYALSISVTGVVKYIGKASDVAITSAGLLLNIMMLKDARGNVTSIVQASKLS